MIEFSRFLMRNPPKDTKAVRAGWAISKACKAHKVGQPDCQWCGTSKNPEAHHIKGVATRPDLALDPMNFITLCRKCHRIVGHNTSFKNRSIDNIVEICEIKEVLLTEAYHEKDTDHTNCIVNN